MQVSRFRGSEVSGTQKTQKTRENRELICRFADVWVKRVLTVLHVLYFFGDVSPKTLVASWNASVQRLVNGARVSP